MSTIDEVRNIVTDTLQLGPRGRAMGEDTPLLGAIPELDSMAVVNLITSIEGHFGFAVGDDEISADAFATLGSLAHFVERKLAEV